MRFCPRRSDCSDWPTKRRQRFGNSRSATARSCGSAVMSQALTSCCRRCRSSSPNSRRSASNFGAWPTWTSSRKSEQEPSTSASRPGNVSPRRCPRAGARPVCWLLRPAAKETPLCVLARAADDDSAFRPPRHAGWCATAGARTTCATDDSAPPTGLFVVMPGVDSLKQAVANGLGIGIVPRAVVSSLTASADLVVMPLGGAGSQRADARLPRQRRTAKCCRGLRRGPAEHGRRPRLAKSTNRHEGVEVNLSYVHGVETTLEYA